MSISVYLVQNKSAKKHLKIFPLIDNNVVDFFASLYVKYLSYTHYFQYEACYS